MAFHPEIIFLLLNPEMLSSLDVDDVIGIGCCCVAVVVALVGWLGSVQWRRPPKTLTCRWLLHIYMPSFLQFYPPRHTIIFLCNQFYFRPGWREREWAGFGRVCVHICICFYYWSHLLLSRASLAPNRRRRVQRHTTRSVAQCIMDSTQFIPYVFFSFPFFFGSPIHPPLSLAASADGCCLRWTELNSLVHVISVLVFICNLYTFVFFFVSVL